MALVPWTYNNPRVQRSSASCQMFTFQGHSVQVLQDADADIDVTKNTGLKLWDGAYLLARHLENTAVFPLGYWTGKQCVELGAGCGLVGIVAWLLGAHVTLTDIEDAVPHTNKCLQTNVKQICRNDTPISREHIRSTTYRWGCEVNDLSPPYDVILGSDIIYQSEHCTDLFKAFNDLSSPTTMIILSYKPRALGEDAFFQILKDNCYEVQEVSNDLHPADFQGSDYKILYIKRLVN